MMKPIEFHSLADMFTYLHRNCSIVEHFDKLWTAKFIRKWLKRCCRRSAWSPHDSFSLVTENTNISVSVLFFPLKYSRQMNEFVKEWTARRCTANMASRIYQGEYEYFSTCAYLQYSLSFNAQFSLFILFFFSLFRMWRNSKWNLCIKIFSANTVEVTRVNDYWLTSSYSTTFPRCWKVLCTISIVLWLMKRQNTLEIVQSIPQDFPVPPKCCRAIRCHSVIVKRYLSISTAKIWLNK